MAEDGALEWQPIEMLATISALVREITEESREQRRLRGKAEVSTLDQSTIERTRRAYCDRLWVIAPLRKQLVRWRPGRLSASETRQFDERGRLLEEDERLSRKILGIVGYGAPK